MQHDGPPFLAVPFCGICRDQVTDFLIVTVVVFIVWSFTRYAFAWFIAQELALVMLLIFVKHQVGRWRPSNRRGDER